MAESNPDPLPPMTEAQVMVLFDALRQVINSPDGCGQVTITVQSRHVRFIQQQVSMDLARAMKWDRLEAAK